MTVLLQYQLYHSKLNDSNNKNECTHSAEPSQQVWLGKQLENDSVTDKERTADNIWLIIIITIIILSLRLYYICVRVHYNLHSKF